MVLRSCRPGVAGRAAVVADLAVVAVVVRSCRPGVAARVVAVVVRSCRPGVAARVVAVVVRSCRPGVAALVVVRSCRPGVAGQAPLPAGVAGWAVRQGRRARPRRWRQGLGLLGLAGSGRRRWLLRRRGAAGLAGAGPQPPARPHE
jgi:hypothetical protein